MIKEDTSLGFHLIDRTQGDELNAINRACPIEADFALVFERGQDFFEWPNLIYDSYQYIGAFSRSELVGYLMVGLFTAWTGEGYGTCGYLGDARVLPPYWGQQLAKQMIGAIEVLVPADARLGFFLVKKGNLPAESLAWSARSAAFNVHPLGDLRVVNIPLLKSVSTPTSLTIRCAQRHDLNAMAELFARANQGKLFAPLLTAERLQQDMERLPHLGLDHYWVAEHQGRLIGMLAAWDMHPFHFTRLLRYSLVGQAMRAANNLVSVFNPGAASMPRAGGSLRTLTVTRIAVEDQDASILEALLSAVIRDNLNKGYHLLNVGFIEGVPLLQATHRFRLVQHFVSSLYGITPISCDFETEGHAAYIDLAMI